MSHFTEESINHSIVYVQSLGIIEPEHYEHGDNSVSIANLSQIFIAHAAGQAKGIAIPEYFSRILENQSPSERSRMCKELYRNCKFYQKQVVRTLIRHIEMYYTFTLSDACKRDDEELLTLFSKDSHGYLLIQALEKQFIPKQVSLSV